MRGDLFLVILNHSNGRAGIDESFHLHRQIFLGGAREQLAQYLEQDCRWGLSRVSRSNTIERLLANQSDPTNDVVWMFPRVWWSSLKGFRDVPWLLPEGSYKDTVQPGVILSGGLKKKDESRVGAVTKQIKVTFSWESNLRATCSVTTSLSASPTSSCLSSLLVRVPL